jgi:two-component system cell cycle sensor histidine kinase/response regulator CckA
MIMEHYNSRSNRFLFIFLSITVLIGATLSLASYAFAEDNKKNVLILNSYHQGYKWTNDETQGALTALDPMKDSLKIYIEYMGTKWVSGDQYFEQLHRLMKYKYQSVRFDVIILSDNDALNFMIKYRDDMFGKVPTVFCGINYFTDDDLKGQPLYTGINETVDVKGTLEIALRLHPSTKNIVVINDTTITGRRLHDELIKIIPSFQQKVRFEFLEDIEMGKLLETVEKFPSDSLIFYTLFSRDKAGKFYEYDESISLISKHSKVPIYGAWDFSLGHGIVGGMLTNGYDQGRAAGEMALRILKVEKIENIPIVRQSPTRYMFDYHQMERFGIKRSDLPQDSIFINEPVSFYALNKRMVWGILAGMAGLIFVVIILLINIHRRKVAEKELRKGRDELETRIQDRTAELSETNVILQQEIEERRQAEGKMIESRQQLTDIINFLPDATLVINKEGKVIAWNRAIEEMTGIRAADMLGKGNYEYALPFYGERRPILVDLVLKPQKEIEIKYVYVERREEILVGESYVPMLRGREACLLGTASALRDSKGDIVGSILSIRDITEKRSVEEALIRAEEKYRGIYENAIEGIFQTTHEGRIVAANPAFARILGYDSPEEVINTITDVARQVYANPERRTELLRLLEEQGIARDFEVQLFRKDKSIAWTTINVRAVRDGSGKLLYHEGSAEDITGRKLMESRIRQSQKIEAIGTLAGGIAHDFNNILAAIIGYTEMTIGRLKQTELHRYLEQVLKASDRAKNLVTQIMTFSRRADKEIKPLDITSLLNEALKLLRATLPSTIEIRIEIDMEVGNVLADPTQLHQVIMNLCTNAAFAMRERGGILEIGLHNEDITPEMVSLYPDLNPGPYVKLTMSDTGTGIAPDIIDRIFDTLFTTKNRGEGTGLGLSVVYGIVRECGGTVTVHSTPGAGSTFSVYLPAVEHEEKLTAEPSDTIPRGSERILFVDDENILAEIGREMLEGIGYEVIAATSSIGALEIFRSQPDRFDLVVTDMTMPGMTGVDLSKELLKIRRDIPIMLCTGFSELITEDEAKRLGIREFLMKPFSLKDIARVVRKVLDERKK